MQRGYVYLILMFLCWPIHQSFAQASFNFCGFSYDESRSHGGLFEQLKDLDQCRPGMGLVWRVRFDPNRSDPTHIAALVCDFSKNVIHEARRTHSNLHREDSRYSLLQMKM